MFKVLVFGVLAIGRPGLVAAEAGPGGNGGPGPAGAALPMAPVQAAQQFLEAGDQAYAAFDTRKALEHYRKAWEADPEAYETRMKYARSLNDAGEEAKGEEAETFFAEAMAQAKALKEKFPDKAEAYFLQGAATGNLLFFKGGSQKVELSRSIEALGKRCLELDPNDSHGYVLLGIYYREVANLNWTQRVLAQRLFGGLPGGSLEDSETMLKKGCELAPGTVYPLYQLAVTLESLEKKEEAAQAYEKISRLAKTDHLDDAKIAEAREKAKTLKK